MKVRLGTKIVDYMVDGMKDCEACGRPLFLCPTGNLRPDGKPKIMPVDAEPQDDGIHVAHFATCSDPNRFRKGWKSRKKAEEKRATGARRPSREDTPR